MVQSKSLDHRQKALMLSIPPVKETKLVMVPEELTVPVEITDVMPGVLIITI